MDLRSSVGSNRHQNNDDDNDKCINTDQPREVAKPRWKGQACVASTSCPGYGGGRSIHDVRGETNVLGDHCQGKISAMRIETPTTERHLLAEQKETSWQVYSG